jgi:hypothetical protein
MEREKANCHGFYIPDSTALPCAGLAARRLAPGHRDLGQARHPHYQHPTARLIDIYSYPLLLVLSGRVTLLTAPDCVQDAPRVDSAACLLCYSQREVGNGVSWSPISWRLGLKKIVTFWRK